MSLIDILEIYYKICFTSSGKSNVILLGVDYLRYCIYNKIEIKMKGSCGYV